jgi:Bacterial Ig-like domain (group 3)
MLISNLPSRGRIAFLVAAALLAIPVLSAQNVRTTEPATNSIISLAPALRPQGEILAHNPGDATFEHAPANYHVFAAATVGEDAGVEALTLNFAAGTKLTRIESRNNDFVIEPGGTCHEGNSYGRGGSCTLLVRFNPQGPGHRLGHLEVAHSAQAEPLYVGLTGNGYAAVVSFTPSQISTVPASVSGVTGTIKSATRMAIDGGDILYIADTGNSLVKEMDSTGSIVTTPLSPIATPASIAVDNFGILYTSNTGSTYYFSVYYPWGSQTAYGYAHASATCTVAAPCAFSAVGMSSPANLSMDPYNNLFFEEGTKGAAEMPVGSISGGSGVLNLWYLSDQFSYSSGSPASFTVDANDNLYTFYNFSSYTCFLLEEPLYNAEYSPTANRVAGGARCGFSGDGGPARSAEISASIGQIAFDIAGNLYFADAGNQRVRRIDASTGTINTIAGTGTAGYTGDNGPATFATLSNPTGVTVDSKGQVYILSNAPTAGPTQVLRKIGVLGYWAFGGQLKGTTSAAKAVTVSNTGNDALVLSAAGFFNGPNPSVFAVDPSTTTCALTAGATLDAGRSCKIGFLFKPTVGGSLSANYVLQDNTVTGTNTIALSGVGTLPVPTFTITSPAASTSVTAGTAVTFSVSVTSTTSPAPTGKVTMLLDGVAIGGSPATLNSSGVASLSVVTSATGTHTLSATYTGDANYGTAGPITRTYTVTAASVVKLASSLNPAKTCKAVAFSVFVTGSSGITPTGNVVLKKGSTVLATAHLNYGAARLSTSALSVGTNMLTATYEGDANNPAATSPEFKEVVLTGGSCYILQPVRAPGKGSPSF